MKKLLIIILLFVVVLPVVGQEYSVNLKHKKQLSLEIKPIGGGLNCDMPINNKYVFTFGLFFSSKISCMYFLVIYSIFSLRVSIGVKDQVVDTSAIISCMYNKNH